LKITVEELAAVIWNLSMGSSNQGDSDLQYKEQLKDVNPDIASRELLFLRMFVVAYAAETFFKSDDIRQKLRQAFIRHVHGVLRGAEESYANGFIDEMNRRVALYSRAVSAESSGRPIESVGKVFATLCTGK